MIYVMFVIVYLAVAILILNAMLMSVTERVREGGSHRLGLTGHAADRSSC